MALIVSGSTGVTDAPLLGWQNLVTVASLASDEEDADYPVTNLANPSTAARWVAESTTDQYVTVTLSGSDPVDYVAIARHNLGSGGATVSVQVSDGGDPESWTTIGTATVPANDEPIMFVFDEEETPPKIRVKLQPDAVIPQMAVLHVGKLLRLPNGIVPGFVPLTWAAMDDVISAESEAGDYLGQIVRRQSLSTSVEVQWIDYDWAKANMADFLAYARQQKPFFFSWMPSSYPSEIGYAWSRNDIRPVAKRTAAGIAVDIAFNLKAVAL